MSAVTSTPSVVFNTANAYPHLAKGCIAAYLPPANEVCEGYVFTGVCLYEGDVCPIACWDTPPQQTLPSRYTLGRYTPQADTP